MSLSLYLFTRYHTNFLYCYALFIFIYTNFLHFFSLTNQQFWWFYTSSHSSSPNLFSYTLIYLQSFFSSSLVPSISAVLPIEVALQSSLTSDVTGPAVECTSKHECVGRDQQEWVSCRDFWTASSAALHGCKQSHASHRCSECWGTASWKCTGYL